MKNYTAFGILIIALLPCVLAFAHPGHDHSHWSATFLNYAFYLSLAFFIVSTAMYLIHNLSGVRNVDHKKSLKLNAQEPNTTH
ncbi:MAG: hypothetical protein GJ680_06100 [Alteromonadaceae bacterium]|nr:hypothetical protein [Alteromonadaceae bacterium]